MNTIESVGVGLAGDVSPPLTAAVAAFLLEKAAELSPYSITHLRVSLTSLAQALHDPPVTAVTYTDLRAYVDGLHLRYRPGTVRPIVGDIRQFFRWCKKRKWIKSSPAKRLKAPSRRVVAETADPKAAPEEDVRRVLDHLTALLARVVWRDVFGNVCHALAGGWTYNERQATRDLFILLFLYETGARGGELQTLSSRAIETAIAASGSACRVVVTGKTGQGVVRFTRATAELWSVWSAVRPPGCSEYAVVSFHEQCDPTPIADRTTISQMIARRCKQAGVAPFRAHALRHAKVKRGKGSVGAEVVGRLVGHSSALITADYGQMTEEELGAAAVATGLSYKLWTT